MGLYRLSPSMTGEYGMAYPADASQWIAGKPELQAYSALRRPRRVEAWPIVAFEVRGRLSDCIPTLGTSVALYSSRLREAIEGALSAEDDVQWLEARVIDVDAPWWVFNPLWGLDGLDARSTVYRPYTGPETGVVLGDVPVKAVFDAGRIQGRSVLKYPYGHEPVVTDGVRDAVVAAGCLGVEFSPVPLA